MARGACGAAGWPGWACRPSSEARRSRSRRCAACSAVAFRSQHLLYRPARALRACRSDPPSAWARPGSRLRGPATALRRGRHRGGRPRLAVTRGCGAIVSHQRVQRQGIPRQQGRHRVELAGIDGRLRRQPQAAARAPAQGERAAAVAGAGSGGGVGVSDRSALRGSSRSSGRSWPHGPREHRGHRPHAGAPVDVAGATRRQPVPREALRWPPDPGLADRAPAAIRAAWSSSRRSSTAHSG